ncbi:MAG: ABC transporter ATP-binding protein [Planctomycetota bacterium]
MNSAPIIQANALERSFHEAGHELHVLRGVDLSINQGEWLSILGRSGSGKSTLLHLLGGLDRPTHGSVVFDGTDIFTLSGGRLDRYRNQHAGFVFQFYHLLPELSALENVLIGSMLGNEDLRRSFTSLVTGGILDAVEWLPRRKQARKTAVEMLERVGLGDRLTHRPAKLSGGERQRVAIARALVNRPSVLLADEPTGNLDADTASSILDLFRSLHNDGQTIAMVTHDQTVADAGDRVVTLVKGKLSAD